MPRRAVRCEDYFSGRRSCASRDAARPEEFAGKDGAYILSAALATSLATPDEGVDVCATLRDPIVTRPRDVGDGAVPPPLIEVQPPAKGTAATRYVLRAAVDRKHFTKLSQRWISSTRYPPRWTCASRWTLASPRGLILSSYVTRSRNP